MSTESLIDAATLNANLGRPDWVIVDCRFDLADTSAGHQAYMKGHIPGAVYAHLDAHLSGPPLTDTGRHPLPSAASLRSLFGGLGIDDSTQVVAYDDSGGAIAARLWWMLGYMSHSRVAVLDGGWAAWKRAGYAMAQGEEQNPPAYFRGEPIGARLATLDEIEATELLVDSREPARYLGVEEPLDPVAGHIPGAVNYYYQQNMSEDGRFLAPAELRRKLESLLGHVSAQEAIFYCGSGVSACHNLLALAHAGMGAGRLYVGSWSEWCRDSERPVATGAETE